VNAGIHKQLDEATYHAHPALSASGAKLLLPPSCPALYKWQRDHPVHRDVFDFGTAAHTKVLGIGPEFAIINADDWRGKAAREERDASRGEGKTPLLAKDAVTVDAMADALRQHPIAAALLNPDHGTPEVSLFWHDERHGIDRRGRVDWLPDPSDGRLIISDYKTAASAEPGGFARSAANFGYHQQAAWYMDAAVALDLAEPGGVSFLFIVQEKTAPHLVTVCELDSYSIDHGRRLNDRACEVFAECTATDTWPGYSDDVELIYLPSWALKETAA
jgi:hypothetical protein